MSAVIVNGWRTAIVTASRGRWCRLGRSHPVSRRTGTAELPSQAPAPGIEANGGLLQDQRGEKLRFWIPTA